MNALVNPRNILLVAAIVIILGSVLPWASVGGFATINGTDGDGVLTLILGVAVIVVALAFVRPRAGRGGGWGAWVALALAVVAGLIALYDLININNLGAGALVSIGIGLILIPIGAVVGIIGGLTRWPRTA